MPTIKLTQLAAERLKPSGAGRVDYRDKQLPLFGIRVSGTEKKPVKTWTVVYRRKGHKKLERITIGSIAKWDKIEDARDYAREILRQAERGEDPKAALKPTEDDERTVEKVVEIFLERYMRAKGRAESYIAETKRIFDQDVLPKWGKRPIRSITRADVRDLLDEIVDDGRPIQANRTLAAVRKLLNWALDRSYIESSPVVKMAAPSAEMDRERVLSAEELRVVWLAADRLGYPFGPMIQMLILTLQRRSEVAEAVWTEFAGLNIPAEAIWRIPSERTKNGEPNDVAMSSKALAILEKLPRWKMPREKGQRGPTKDCPYLFTTNTKTAVSGFAKAKARIDEKIMDILREEADAAGKDPEQVKPFERWTFHDLRRTGTTRMAEDLGIAPHVVDAILNHVSSTIKGVARTYNRATFAKPKRLALEAWGGYIDDLLTAQPAPSNVHSLRAGK